MMERETSGENGQGEMRREAARWFERANELRRQNDPRGAARCYAKAAACGHPAAANNLGVMYRGGEGVAQDVKRAFYLFSQAASQGNMTAVRNMARCCWDGAGTQSDHDLAVSWLTSAARKGDALACEMLADIYGPLDENDQERRLSWLERGAGLGSSKCREYLEAYYEKKRQEKDIEKAVLPSESAGISADPACEAHRDDTMPPQADDVHSSKKEYYRQDVNSFKCAYGGKIYYTRYSDLCVSDLEGGQIQVLAKEKKYESAYIQVNITGIYLYCFDEEDGKERLRVKRLGFDGRAIQETKDRGRARCVYVYDDQVYYVVTRKAKRGGEYFDTDEIRRMNMSTGQVDKLYTKAESVSRLCASESWLAFKAEYVNNKRKYSCEDDGWMLLNLGDLQTQCLSSDVRSPESVVDDPEVYNDESPRYIEDGHKREIAFVDLGREIFWVEKTGEGGEDSLPMGMNKYWEPRRLWGPREEPAAGMPVWKITWNSGGMREYFDGEHYYLAEDYYHFMSADRYGTSEQWNDCGHGDCGAFTVTGGYLFLDLQAYDEEQYELTAKKAAPIRKSWFRDI